MQGIKLLFGGGTSSEESPASVLAEWNKYSDEKAEPSQSDRLMTSMEQGSATLQKAFGESFTRLSTGVTSASTTLTNTVANAPTLVPSATQFAHFAAFMGAGIFFLILAFTMFLPVIIIAPAKFASCFTLGSLLIMAGFTALKGWKQQLAHMFSKERLPFSAVYISTMVATLYAALVMHSYIFSIICCGCQVMAMAYYCMSYFPGGAEGVKFVMRMFVSGFMSMVSGVQRMIFR